MSSLLEQATLAGAGQPRAASVTAASRSDDQRTGLIGFLEERFLVPTYSSPRSGLWVAAHRTLSVPLQLRGTARCYRVRPEGQELRVVAIGRPKRFERLLRRLFGELTEVEGTTSRLLWDPPAIESLEADLTIAEVHRWFAPRFRGAGWILMPDSVRWAGDMASIPPALPSHSLRDDLRKLRRRDYTLEQTTAWQRWEEFYDTMLLPQALSRFGNAAWKPSRRFLRELAARGVLHVLRLDGRPVAGACTVRNSDSLWLPLTGVLNGDRALMQQGVSAAVFLQVFGWARNQGITRIDVGRTSPFMNDGIFRSKSKWGLRPVVDPLSHLIALRVGPSESLRHAFASQPVMVEGLDGLQTYTGE